MSAPDLSVIVVSHGDAAWLPSCIESLAARAGAVGLDLVVVENGPVAETRDLLERRFPEARLVEAENHGFAHGNNEGLLESRGHHVLFLNPDTEIREGGFDELLQVLDRRPDVGAVGVRQVDVEGRLLPSIRRSPNALRALGEALGSERLPLPRAALGERELSPAAYERETECDWVAGSFLLVRREALLSAGWMDERMFLYSEETDLCTRIRRAGWRILNVPCMTIVHHERPARSNSRNLAQAALSRGFYARKHFSPLHRFAYLAALALGYLLRGLPLPGRGDQRMASRAALAALLGRRPPPYESPPDVAVRPR